jgi:hypothetical protein
MEECKQQRRKEELQKIEKRNEKSHRLGQEGIS